MGDASRSSRSSVPSPGQYRGLVNSVPLSETIERLPCRVMIEAPAPPAPGGRSVVDRA